MTMPGHAMVLAAGLGLRMRPLTKRTPKPLIPVAGRSMLDRVFDRLDEAGVPNRVVNTHWLADQIARHLATPFRRDPVARGRAAGDRRWRRPCASPAGRAALLRLQCRYHLARTVRGRR